MLLGEDTRAMWTILSSGDSSVSMGLDTLMVFTLRMVLVFLSSLILGRLGFVSPPEI